MPVGLSFPTPPKIDGGHPSSQFRNKIDLLSVEFERQKEAGIVAAVVWLSRDIEYQHEHEHASTEPLSQAPQRVPMCLAGSVCCIRLGVGKCIKFGSVVKSWIRPAFGFVRVFFGGTCQSIQTTFQGFRYLFAISELNVLFQDCQRQSRMISAVNNATVFFRVLHDYLSVVPSTTSTGFVLCCFVYVYVLFECVVRDRQGEEKSD